MSAQPAVDARQLRKNEMKLAMAVGENRHYAVNRITLRHFIQSAQQGGISEREARDILAELADACEDAIDHALHSLPAQFPEDLAESVTQGVRKRARQMARGL